MSVYFQKFPTVSYGGMKVRDISRRTNFIQSTLANPMLFLPYTIPEGMKAEDVAYHYYGSVDYTWLVLLANNLLDPYTDWPMDYDMFNDYLIAKYSEQANAEYYDVIAWTQNDTITENILFYYKELDTGETIQVGPETFSSVDAAFVDGFSVMRIYDHENLVNEAKRNIQLVDYEYKDMITAEFASLIKK